MQRLLEARERPLGRRRRSPRAPFEFGLARHLVEALANGWPSRGPCRSSGPPCASGAAGPWGRPRPARRSGRGGYGSSSDRTTWGVRRSRHWSFLAASSRRSGMRELPRRARSGPAEAFDAFGDIAHQIGNLAPATEQQDGDTARISMCQMLSAPMELSPLAATCAEGVASPEDCPFKPLPPSRRKLNR